MLNFSFFQFYIQARLTESRVRQRGNNGDQYFSSGLFVSNCTYLTNITALFRSIILKPQPMVHIQTHSPWSRSALCEFNAHIMNNETYSRSEPIAFLTLAEAILTLSNKPKSTIIPLPFNLPTRTDFLYLSTSQRSLLPIHYRACPSGFE